MDTSRDKIGGGLYDDKSDHRHQWVISQETFWTDHGGDIRMMWCEVCDGRPGPGQLPCDLEPGYIYPDDARPRSEPACLCGADRSPNGFRLDIVCPKHDGVFPA